MGSIPGFWELWAWETGWGQDSNAENGAPQERLS